MVARQIDLFKASGITAMATTLAHDETSAAGMSSLVDTWLLLRNVESNGERNRLLFVLKSRGSAHSNQVREFVLTDSGVQLVDVYVGPDGVVTGSARLVQEAQQRRAELQQDEDLSRRRRELRRGVVEGEAKSAELQDEVAADRAELERIAGREQRQAADAEADRSALASQRWADSAPRDEAPRDEAPRDEGGLR
jgi:circadian clock protein KaiC